MKRLVTIFLIFCCLAATAQLQFKSGKDGFTSFLREKTIYPSFSKNNCIQGTVNISFKLDEKGNVYSSRVTKSILSELDEEALRLVRLSSGKWKVPVGYDTTTAVIVPVNFKLSGFNCEGKSSRDMQDAIRSYQAEEGLTNSVINFYKNINQAKPGQEAQIIVIKNQLGIDDDYLNERIDNGLKKIKQGDKQGACEDFLFVKNMGSSLADQYLSKYCK
ncbi:energy transducer TonB [Pedobacter sp. Leaf41]|jgi:TonB family protein|uniref:energy transducer TonB n=1 Tax=Pedobacter sp. Leaf41 TaxID=1736218 RepID=UPI000703533B|nr:TonB family protein [Pedobacter sp. Leaf41]KQN38081.1 energy transducer TonB [Pedobacter sp. Leaf41]